jgi:surfeit locus 1 family protein
VSARPRFPYVLTLAAAIVFAVCIGLGLWQVKRFEWKQRELAKIDALRTAPPQLIAPVLARAAAGQDMEFTRVEADCAAVPPRPAAFVMGVDNGDYVWRALSPCDLTAPPYNGVIIDRGYLDDARGRPQAPARTLPTPGRVVGVLRHSAAPLAASDLDHPAPLLLVAEHETPAAPGVTPSPWQSQAPDNLQYVGEYAPTWFGLAGVLAAFYAAMLWRRLRSPR